MGHAAKLVGEWVAKRFGGLGGVGLVLGSAQDDGTGVVDEMKWRDNLFAVSGGRSGRVSITDDYGHVRLRKGNLSTLGTLFPQKLTCEVEGFKWDDS